MDDDLWISLRARVAELERKLNETQISTQDAQMDGCSVNIKLAGAQARFRDISSHDAEEIFSTV